MAGPTSYFGNTEEAFLLSSMKEFVKVWASGNRAKINVECDKGTAWLNISFSLGRPDASHHVAPYHHHRRRQKGPGRRERDRARAVNHQNMLQSREEVSDETETVPA